MFEVPKFSQEELKDMCIAYQRLAAAEHYRQHHWRTIADDRTDPDDRYLSPRSSLYGYSIMGQKKGAEAADYAMQILGIKE